MREIQLNLCNGGEVNMPNILYGLYFCNDIHFICLLFIHTYRLALDYETNSEENRKNHFN